ncbi:hypothetical protein NXF25_006625 [Crotalus adamanteus]|uniref:Uncharacterized protein n=1 Tax=Crotalus adamanteus TaxID=8729 RepID=A0AAW1BZS6_CROAD
MQSPLRLLPVVADLEDLHAGGKLLPVALDRDAPHEKHQQVFGECGDTGPASELCRRSESIKKVLIYLFPSYLFLVWCGRSVWNIPKGLTGCGRPWHFLPCRRQLKPFWCISWKMPTCAPSRLSESLSIPGTSS